MTWPQVEERAAAVLAIPLGATEQHGPHLPLSVDTDTALTLCRRLAAVRPHVLVAPALPYGASGEHAGFPGTLSIGHEALEHVLVELARSAARTFPRVLFVSGHGGNARAVRAAVVRLVADGLDVAVHEPRWSGDPHAGRVETALMLALDPARVDMAAAEAGDTRPLAELMPALRAEGVRAVSANGVLGDPRGATAAEGVALLDRLTADLVAQFDVWLSIPASLSPAPAPAPTPTRAPAFTSVASEEVVAIAADPSDVASVVPPAGQLLRTASEEVVAIAADPSDATQGAVR
ncbi:MAG: mycofactocin biosynthesis peptidyl-dipeptidase MftE [Sporichthyaceae bacterium]